MRRTLLHVHIIRVCSHGAVDSDYQSWKALFNTLHIFYSLYERGKSLLIIKCRLLHCTGGGGTRCFIAGLSWNINLEHALTLTLTLIKKKKNVINSTWGIICGQILCCWHQTQSIMLSTPYRRREEERGGWCKGGPFSTGQCNHFSSTGQECQISQAATLLHASTECHRLQPYFLTGYPVASLWITNLRGTSSSSQETEL